MIIRHNIFAIYVLAFVTLCDQLSKWWVEQNVKPHEIFPVTPFLNFLYVWNKGVTFGMLNQMAPGLMPLILTGAAILILIFLGRWLMRTSSALVAISLGAIMGGAIGNVIDRVRFGAVFDFLDFYYRDYHYPWAFNIADAAIVTGVIFLMLDSLVRGR